MFSIGQKVEIKSTFGKIIVELKKDFQNKFLYSIKIDDGKQDLIYTQSSNVDFDIEEMNRHFQNIQKYVLNIVPELKKVLSKG